MRVYLFERARKILLEGYVTQKDITSQNTYFEVVNELGEVYHVQVGYRDNDLCFSCDCPYMSIAGTTRGTFCAHVLACFGYLMGIRQKK